MPDLKEVFKEFEESYDESLYNSIWKEKSAQFSSFWKNDIMSSHGPLNDQDIDEIVRMIDKHGKGSKPNTQAVAKVMVPQGAWRRMFNHFVEKSELREALNTAMYDNDINAKISAINSLYRLNAGNKNNLTGQTASAINAFLAVSKPFENLSICSLNDRKKILDYLNVELSGYQEMSIGDKVVTTNTAIIDYMKSNNFTPNARKISVFFYESRIKDAWRNVSDINDGPETQEGKETDQIASEPLYSDEQLSFYMESHLEDFLIENWDKTALSEKYELIEEKGELVSQQYRTDIGVIDILAKERGTNNYVVIELKKGQSSDDTVGQISRYMGWIDEHKASEPNTKGVIIAGKYDRRLYYALKKFQEVEVFIYKIDFVLDEYKES